VECWQVGHGDVDEEVVVAGQHVDRADLRQGEREGLEVLDDLPAERADLPPCPDRPGPRRPGRASGR
jgi:hypothetical protein